MNRLIIVGNGFDLAHGLKTSSTHFIVHYFRNIVWKKLLDEGEYSDRLIKIENAYNYFSKKTLPTKDDLILEVFKEIDKPFSQGPYEARLIIKSTFFRSIFNKIFNLKWADFETEYFNELYFILEETAQRSKQSSTPKRVDIETEKNNNLVRLNGDLDYLKYELIKYLKIQENEFSPNCKIIELYNEYFREDINPGSKIPNITSESPSELYFLNFNYTNTLEKYTKDNKINYIHGKLNRDTIFGFGDDTSEKYHDLENEYNNEFIKKIKSFKYLDNISYHDLIRFINKDDYQVHIYGHSCGVSDRTLFKKIFENDKCKSIKIFYHNENDFEDKKYEISRHFKNKHSFLEKVITFNYLEKMPQCSTNK